MKKTFLLILAAASLSLAAAGCATCTTTGDPNKGGLFCWSEDKAKQRQAEARAALDREGQRGAELRGEKARLQRELNAKQHKLEALKVKTQADGPSSAEAAEISRLEREIEQLQKETLVLMDL